MKRPELGAPFAYLLSRAPPPKESRSVTKQYYKKAAVDVTGAAGPFQVEAELWYQPIAYRWAQNPSPYDLKETNRFVGYSESMSDVSGTVLATGTATTQ